MADLTLYADQTWESPWAFHAMVALEELRVTYKLDPIKRPIAKAVADQLREHALLPKVPCLVHGELWLTESSAISEYLAELFPPPEHRHLLPSNREQRARARQVMSWLRTSLMGLREDRPTSSVFMRPVSTPLGERAQRDVRELLHVAEKLLAHGGPSLFDEWCMADADLALMLMRLVANRDPVPQRIADYCAAQWGRDSIRRYLAHITPAA